MSKLYTSSDYCGIPFNPQPHHGFKQGNTVLIEGSKANNAQIKNHNKNLEQLYDLYCYLKNNQVDKVGIQFRGNYIEVVGTFNITDEEFEKYRKEREEQDSKEVSNKDNLESRR